MQPGSGPDGYYGVQSEFDPDPFYYRPDLDAPRHPGLLRAAVQPFHSSGLAPRTVPVLGDHDTLVAGEIVPTPAHAGTRGRRPGAVGAAERTDAPQERVARARGLAGRAAEPRPDRQLPAPRAAGSDGGGAARPARREMPLAEVVARLRARQPLPRGRPAPASGWTTCSISGRGCA